MQADQADIGLCGLGVMGRNLVLNLADHGHTVAVYNRTTEKTRAFVDANPGHRLIPCATLAELAERIAKPAPIIMMVQAGPAVDDQIDQLLPHLIRGDILIDGGNSFFEDTRRRAERVGECGMRYLGVGISGGEEGARHGPSIMPGGDLGAYRAVEAMLTCIAARVDGQRCCAYVGPDGAGHYVKMVHNGIEYADMQLIAETYYLLRHLLGMEYDEMADVFADWNRGRLESYLVEITADILRRRDPDTGKPMAEIVLDRAGQKGTGAWTSESALALGVPAPTVAEAVFARSLSALKDQRMHATSVLPGPTPIAGGERKVLLPVIRDALYAAKICCYAQGFDLLAAASRNFAWNLDLGRLAMLWRGGCIIRAAFLSRINEAYHRKPDLANLLLDPYFTEAVSSAQGGWREIAALALANGIAVPAFTSALSYYDGYRTRFLWANLIQAQRDYFGAHTYERVDKPGVFHTDWLNLG